MNKRGFTIVEFMILLAIIEIFLVTVLAIAFERKHLIKSRPTKESSEISMTSYIEQLYPELIDIKVLCSNKDSDLNNYIRCSGTGIISNNKRQVVVAECDNNICVPIQNIDR